MNRIVICDWERVGRSFELSPDPSVPPKEGNERVCCGYGTQRSSGEFFAVFVSDSRVILRINRESFDVENSRVSIVVKRILLWDLLWVRAEGRTVFFRALKGRGSLRELEVDQPMDGIDRDMDSFWVWLADLLRCDERIREVKALWGGGTIGST